MVRVAVVSYGRAAAVIAFGALLAVLAGTLVNTQPAGAGVGIPTFTVVVSKSGSGAGSVTSEPAGIVCGEFCEGEFPLSETVTLVAASEKGSRHKGWDGTIKGVSKRLTVLPPSDGLPVQVEAVFDEAARPVAKPNGKLRRRSKVPRAVSLGVGCGEPVACRLRVTPIVAIWSSRKGYQAYQALSKVHKAPATDKAYWNVAVGLGSLSRKMNTALKKYPGKPGRIRFEVEDLDTGLGMAIKIEHIHNGINGGPKSTK